MIYGIGEDGKMPSAQNVRKSICRKGLSRFYPMCTADVAHHVQKTALIPTYMGIYFSCYVFSIFKGVSNVRESYRVTALHP